MSAMEQLGAKLSVAENSEQWGDVLDFGHWAMDRAGVSVEITDEDGARVIAFPAPNSSS